MNYSKSPYRRPATAQVSNNNGRGRVQSRGKSPFASTIEEPAAPQTFVFSDLPQDEKGRFMEFLLNNDVEFQYD